MNILRVSSKVDGNTINHNVGISIISLPACEEVSQWRCPQSEDHAVDSVPGQVHSGTPGGICDLFIYLTNNCRLHCENDVSPMFFTVHWFISEPSVRVCPSVYITKQLLSSCSASHFIIHCFYLHLKIKSLTSRLKTSDLDRLVLGLEPYNSNYASWVAINYQPLCVLTRNWEMCWVTRLVTSSHWLFPLGAVNVSGTARVAWDLMSESRDFYLSNL